MRERRKRGGFICTCIKKYECLIGLWLDTLSLLERYLLANKPQCGRKTQQQLAAQTHKKFAYMYEIFIYLR